MCGREESGNDNRNICRAVTSYTATAVKQGDTSLPRDPFVSDIWERKILVPTSYASEVLGYATFQFYNTTSFKCNLDAVRLAMLTA